MQLMIDLDTERPDGMRFAAEVLLRRAAMIDVAEGRTMKPGADVPPPPPPRAPIEKMFPTVDDTGPVAGSETQPDFSPPPIIPPPPMATAPPALNAVPPPPALSPVPSGALNSAPPAPTSISTTSLSEIDSAGIPWDSRIHQTGRSQKKDGSWKIRKGLDEAVVSAVIKELHESGLIRHVGPSVLPAPARVAVPPPPLGNVPPPPPSNVVPLHGNVPPPPSVDAAGEGNPSPFRLLLDKVGEANKAQKLTPMRLLEIVQSHGVPTLQAMKSLPMEKFRIVCDDIDAEILSAG